MKINIEISKLINHMAKIEIFFYKERRNIDSNVDNQIYHLITIADFILLQNKIEEKNFP